MLVLEAAAALSTGPKPELNEERRPSRDMAGGTSNSVPGCYR